MSVFDGTLDLVGCKFSGNSATEGDDIAKYQSTANIDGCPAGFYGAAGAALETYNTNGGTTTGEAKSYSCGACVR